MRMANWNVLNAFKSQLEQHKPSHVLDCSIAQKKDVNVEHDLRKYLKSHDGEEHYCTQCDYSNPDERLLKQHMNKHLKNPPGTFAKNVERGICTVCSLRDIQIMDAKH